MKQIHNINDVDDLLDDTPSARDLHSIWERRRPIPDPDQKKSYADAEDLSQIPWADDVSLARKFTRQALRREEYLLVVDASREFLRSWPRANENDRTELVHVRQDLAEALSRLGFMKEAREELERCVAPDFKPVLGRRLKTDILLQLGHIIRDEWHYAAARQAQTQTAQDALRVSERVLELDPRRLEALILKAATCLLLATPDNDMQAQSAATARLALERTKELNNSEGPRVITTSAEATAHALLGETDEAARCYEQLQHMGTETAYLAQRRFEARFLAEALGMPRNTFDKAFPALKLVVFAGHLPDHPDRTGGRVRFPHGSIPAAKKDLRAKIASLGTHMVGLASASAGADLLFVEAMQELKHTVHLVLPWSKDEFLNTSVLPYEPAAGPAFWTPLFEEALDKAATVREIGQVYEPGDDAGWQYLIEVTAGIASQTARALRLDVQPMVLWDGLQGVGAGGTWSFHALWDELGKCPEIVKPPAVKEQESAGSGVRARRSERSIMHQEVKSMLFADVVGYSKLTEKVIPAFVSVFLERIAQLIAKSPYKPCSVNTWGDAVCAYFDTGRDAGLFALELTQMVQDGEADWRREGLCWREKLADGTTREHPLMFRIGLHTGPVVMHNDPIVRRIAFTGTHVNRAARIEPVTPHGQVYASEEFAAMAEINGEFLSRNAGRTGGPSDLGFVCEYAGTKQLAKNFPGRHRIYRVVPKRTFAIEGLAMAVHELYCEERKAKGETAETNLSMRPWEQLGEDLRESNRAQAADIPNKLRLLGYELAPGGGLKTSEMVITDPDVERLAIMEHERWMSERMLHGWRYGTPRDNLRKLHPLLVPWEQLPESEKDKDRVTIRNLRPLVEKAGFRVAKIEGR